jgi:hypothetical protein
LSSASPAKSLGPSIEINKGIDSLIAKNLSMADLVNSGRR